MLFRTEETGKSMLVQNALLEHEHNGIRFEAIYKDVKDAIEREKTDDPKAHVSVGLKCANGRRRSVAFAEMMAKRLKEEGVWKVEIVHRDLEKERIPEDLGKGLENFFVIWDHLTWNDIRKYFSGRVSQKKIALVVEKVKWELDPKPVKIKIISYGWRHGPSKEKHYAGLLDMSNVYMNGKELSRTTESGLSEYVQRGILEESLHNRIRYEQIYDITGFAVKNYIKDAHGRWHGETLKIGYKDDNGRHQSVAFAEMVGKKVTEKGLCEVEVVHRDVEKPIIRWNRDIILKETREEMQSFLAAYDNLTAEDLPYFFGDRISEDDMAIIFDGASDDGWLWRRREHG
ncbi:uncharacterized protein BDZ99DRAFT_259644 [Mytilinidion resinicola]|uniref:RapZ C-terminal domain-containing protein n=1 Tax=Mytilinidion resinicola TaxID=574789 RepID=A0A6A6YXX8_9PEZI|nr:uncharacterized protein BDZ99DRAFT_259644 [Mytilinidion resinicola]KAF2813630.1 hypothetical protein BDZ99DRAFT_259644 [Mytilinidion resinicola]